jgi:Secretion system C-terminal sorting domain
MKRYLVMLAYLVLLSGGISQAQSYVVIRDSLPCVTTGTATFPDSIVITSAPDSFYWKVVATDFPTDWQASCVLCDNAVCKGIDYLWPASDTERTLAYAAGDTSVLSLTLDATTITTVGCYFVTVRLYEAATPADSIAETWGVCYGTTFSAVTAVNPEGMRLFPDPAKDELFITGAGDAEKVCITDVMGRIKGKYKCYQGRCSVPVATLPSGIYFARTYERNGAPGQAHKFIKY